MDRNTLGAHFIKGNFAAPNDVDQDAVNLDGLHLANNFDYVVSDAVLHVLSKEQQACGKITVSLYFR